jgi:hypothetical protein
MFDGNFVLNQESKIRKEAHVSVEDVKHNVNLRTEEMYDDEFIALLIDAAIEDAEMYTGMNLALNEIAFKMYNFSGNILPIQESPLSDIVLFQSSTDGIVWTTIPASSYMVKKERNQFIIYFNDIVEYTYLKLTIDVGFDVDKLPKNAWRAIVLKASDMFDTERGNYSAKAQNNNVYKSLLDSFYTIRW